MSGTSRSSSPTGASPSPPGASPGLDEVLARLLPFPEDGSRPDGPVAVDATDRLLLDEARRLIEAAPPGTVVTVGDRFGALTLGVLALWATSVRVHQDPITAEAALDANARELGLRRPLPPDLFTHHPLGRGLLAGARVVLLQLPKSLAELTEIAEQVAAHAADDVTLLAGGRVKHMTLAMNDVLAASFAQVQASRARQKSRLLVARGPRPPAAFSYPVTAEVSAPELARRTGRETLTVVAHGAAFAGATLDVGTRFLLAQSARWPALTDPAVVDLGCGTGILATVAALRYPGARVVATDRSAGAVASAAATAAANGADVVVLRDDAGSTLPDASADLVLCNPPFHDRAALSTDAAHLMFATAGRVLREGGELWTVFNTPLRYRPALERLVGPTEHVAQNPKFTVTRSLRRPTSADGANDRALTK